MDLCLPAHQHHLLQLGITTLFATISMSFNLFFFPYICHSWDFIFIPTYCSSSAYQKKVLICHIWKSFWECDFFFKRNHPADFDRLNSIIVEVLKMLKVKTYFQFLLLLPVRVEWKKGKKRGVKKVLNSL